MKILYISSSSGFTAPGGMEYHLLDITRWLREKGVETALAVRKNTVMHRALLAGRPHVYPLSMTGFGKIASLFELIRAIRDFSPDIISINRERDIVRVFFIVKIAAPLFRKRPKLVSVFHNRGWRKRQWVLSRLDGLIFPNAYLQNIYLSRDDAAHGRSSVIYHGIHLPGAGGDDKPNPFRKRKYFTGSGFPLIGMVGELRKNQTELIDVAYHLKRILSDFTIALVGGGNEGDVKALREKIGRLGLTKHVILTGNVDRSRIPDIFYDLDISVTTNRSEPFGLVFLESLAASTPVVAYDSGGPVEILEKGGGKLVSGGPEEMARELFELVSDHEARRIMAREARIAAEKYFSIDAMGENHYNFYVKVLGNTV